MLKKIKPIFCVLVISLLCFSSFVTIANAQECPIIIVIDGKVVNFGENQVPVLTESGRVLVPMRAIFETMGAKLDWAEETNTVMAAKGGNIIVLKIGEKVARKNNVAVALDQPVELINNRTFVPIRFVGEALGAKVDWSEETKEVLINTISAGEEPNKNNEDTTSQPVEQGKPKRIKVLAIGNSFSQDSSRYLHDIAAADGVVLTIANLYVGGCSLQSHWNYASKDTKAYDYELNGKSTGKKVSIKEALESNDWNYITMQQVSQDSGIEESFFPYIENLAKYVKGIKPSAELLIHQTWAYEKNSNHSGFRNYGGDQKTMFDLLKSAYDTAATKVGLLTLDDGREISEKKKPLMIIPSGKAMQNARANPIFDTTYGDGKMIRLNRDGFHATYTYGRYLLGAVWYECLTGNKIKDNKYSDPEVAENELDILKKAAHDAVVEYGWQKE